MNIYMHISRQVQVGLENWEAATPCCPYISEVWQLANSRRNNTEQQVTMNSALILLCEL